MVARGFTQVYGVDYEETFAPTIRYDALRIFLAIAAKNNWKVHQVDIVTAFLAGKLDEVIYLRVPYFLQYLLGDYVQILRSLYGLKQAARVWHLLLEEFLKSIGFIPLPSDPSVLTNGKVIISGLTLAVYVDDILIAGEHEEDIVHVKQLLKERFEVKDLGEVRVVLGIRVKRYGQRMTLDQSQYAAVILKQFLDDTSPTYLIPMEPDAVHKLADTGGEILTEERKSWYLQAIGKLMHLCHTRPDIVFSVHKLAQFSSQPYLIHESALKRIFGYIKYTISFGIQYGGEQIYSDLDYFTVDHNIIGYAGTSKKEDMQAFADADHASDPVDRKSIRGYVFTISGGAVCFNSTKQRSVAGSTTEAEYIALSLASRQAIWTCRLVSSIEGTSTNSAVPLLFGDNKASLQLSKGVSNTSKIKHIDISFHQIIDEVKNGSIKLFWIPSEEMLADGFTKPLPQPAFEDKDAHIRVVDIEKDN